MLFVYSFRPQPLILYSAVPHVPVLVDEKPNLNLPDELEWLAATCTVIEQEIDWPCQIEHFFSYLMQGLIFCVRQEWIHRVSLAEHNCDGHEHHANLNIGCYFDQNSVFHFSVAVCILLSSRRVNDAIVIGNLCKCKLF